ncbi:MAG: 2-isopropylmalate synthase [Planctomycetaceae bacterium]|jgi:2-isopropylmalate synthase|nr:2-isopropylmalate synthase [Planctomycetaceae bacterium]
MRTIKIFDTTLRDGEQSPGASMNLREKLEVALALAELGVDVIEAGFAVASPGDFESVREVARIVRGSSVCSLARCVESDIDAAAESLKEAEQPRIHIFLATSPIHREYKLKMTAERNIESVHEAVIYARRFCPDIEFSAEDATRSEIDHLCRVVETAISAGATTVNIPDTVGYATPTEMYERISTLMNRVPNIDKAVISVHNHNDLGMAVATSLAAVLAGAGQVECTINGLGERAGNCSLEEVVMAIKTRHDVYNAKTRIITPKLVPTSRLVATVTGLKVPRNKAIVGQNAFAHESGIHQDGMLKNPTTYEIMLPSDVGFQKTDLVLGKHSGRAALADRAKTLGFELDADQLAKVFVEFKKLADRKKSIYDDDILALIEQNIHEQPNNSNTTKEVWSLVAYNLQCCTGGEPTVTLTLRYKNKEYTKEISDGDGPIDAIFLAIRDITGADISLKEYSVQSVTGGQDAQGEVTILINKNGDTYRGYAVSTDTIEASTTAILNAVNRILLKSELRVQDSELLEN